MHALPAKQRVRSAFDRAAASYDAAATLQRDVCQRLLEGMGSVGGEGSVGGVDSCSNAKTSEGFAPGAILDAGCGTGYGSRLLRARWPEARLSAADFAPAMVELARSSVDEAFVADIEALPCAPASFDLWWSSLSIQWCSADAVFAEAARVLRPGGRLAVSTLGPETFHELRSAFRGIDGYRHTIGFNTPEKTVAALAAAGFRNIEMQRQRLSVHYPDLKSLLRAVKAIGANAVGSGARNGLMARAAWQALENSYESHRLPAGLPASYDVIFCYAEK